MPTATIYVDFALPKFLLGSSHLDDQDSDFIVHLHAPRFVMRMNEDGSASADVQFVDPPDPLTIASLMREAGDYYIAELKNLEEL